VHRCKEWERTQQRAANGGGVDDATREVFTWWCAQPVQADTSLCRHWRRVSTPSTAATSSPEAAAATGGDGDDGMEEPPPSKAAVGKVHEHFCLVAAHRSKEPCVNSPYKTRKQLFFPEKGQGGG
jgi:hypothetical protein